MTARFSAIVLAGGKGSRMNSNVHKQYLTILGEPVLYYSLKAMQESPKIDEIVLVVGEGEEEYCRREFVEKYHLTKVTRITVGGKERYHSVMNGLEALTIKDGYVLIHDGARPCLNGAIIDRCVANVARHNACVVGMPVKDTVKIIDSDGFSQSTPDRRTLWIVQTPQCFATELITDAYRRLRESGFEKATDDAQTVEMFRPEVKVKLIEGSYTNIKVTTPEDLETAEQFLRQMKNAGEI